MTRSLPFPARYPGRCAACQERIDVDDQVAFDDDELVHDGCTPKAPRPERPACPTCFTVPSVSGACECDE